MEFEGLSNARYVFTMDATDFGVNVMKCIHTQDSN